MRRSVLAPSDDAEDEMAPHPAHNSFVVIQKLGSEMPGPMYKV